MASILRLLPLLFVAGLVQSQCSENTCTEQCYPDRAERDLCEYYAALSQWYTSAQGCGELSLPALPSRDLTASSQDQWMQARVYWNTVRALWEELADRNGVFESQSTNPPSSESSSSSQEDWLQDISVWRSHFSQWEEFAENQAELDSSTGSVVFSSGSSSAIIRGNSDNWNSVLRDWSDSYIAYNRTYNGMCPLI